jgi:Holliday junction DNA helicase RuvA
MISWLEGVWRGSAVVTSCGVGYSITSPHSFSDGEKVSLRIVTIQRENGTYFFGFKEESEEKLFHTLIKIQGVGPNAAVALLAKLGLVGVINAIKSKEISVITSVSGVGKKLGERILSNVSLSDDLLNLSDDNKFSYQDLINSLVDLGFSFDSAKGSVQSAVDEIGDGVDESIVLQRALEIARGVR